MDKEKRRLICEGNALYEIDLECLKQKNPPKGKSGYHNNRNMYAEPDNHLNKKPGTT